MQSQRSIVETRFWRLSDAAFIVQCRNTPALQRWFKQDKDLTLDDQLVFMTETAPSKSYYGFIVEVHGKPIGFTCLRLDGNREAEFGIGILPQYQGKGYTKEAVKQVLSCAFNEFSCHRVYGDVFVDNPALSFYLFKCGFKAVSVKENKYIKKNVGSVSVVDIEQRK